MSRLRTVLLVAAIALAAVAALGFFTVSWTLADCLGVLASSVGVYMLAQLA